MSYSFPVKATSKDDAKKQIADQMANVVNSQPDHALDQAAVVAAASAFVDMLDIPDGSEMIMNVHGSVSWSNHVDQPKLYTGAGVGISVHVAKIKSSANA